MVLVTLALLPPRGESEAKRVRGLFLHCACRDPLSLRGRAAHEAISCFGETHT